MSDQIQTQGVVKDVFYDEANERLYIAADEGDLEIWDVQNAENPQHLSTTTLYYFNVEVPVISVVAIGDSAYVSTRWGYLHGLDVSDPTNPVDVGFSGVGGNPSRGLALGDDGNLYLAGPDTVKFTPGPNGAFQYAGANNYTTSYEVSANDGFVYASRNGTLQILSNQGSLPLVGNYPVNGGIADIYADGDYAYIAAGLSGLVILDVTDKSAVIEVGREGSGASDVVVSAGLAYVSAGFLIRVIDVTVPSAPSVVGTLDIQAGGAGNIAPIANAGPSQAVPSRARGVRLNGRNSRDVDGTIASYSWTQISGPNVRLKRANTARPKFRAPKVRRLPVARLTFRLTVTDNEGATASDDVVVTVFPR